MKTFSSCLFETKTSQFRIDFDWATPNWCIHAAVTNVKTGRLLCNFGYFINPEGYNKWAVTKAKGVTIPPGIDQFIENQIHKLI